MNEKTIRRVLTVTGIATLLPGLQFLAPTLFLQASGMQVGDPTGLFFARHWGLVVFCIGTLLVYAARRPDLRGPILFAATIEKLGLVIMVMMAWNEPTLKGMHVPAIFDFICVVLYLSYLLRTVSASTSKIPGRAKPTPEK